MSTYVISDIHGEYEKFNDLLKKIDLKDTDTLYVLGDVLDRGHHPIRTLLQLMEMDNAVCLAGNHELMALDCLEFLTKNSTDIPLDKLDEEVLDALVTWQYNGSSTTISEFRSLSLDTQQRVIDYLMDMPVYEKLTVSGREYLLVHAGLGNYSPDKELDDYSMDELVWDRADYNVQYFDDVYVVTGHTPTQTIQENDRPGYIFRKNNHIAVDCGACYPDGRLAAIRLDDGMEFYSEIISN